MKIELMSLSLHNFMGEKDKTFKFGSQTTISGSNATGKTRIFNAFLWLLFGKDIEDRKDFSIKSLDQNNEPIHRVDYSVNATLLIDNIETTLERIYREKWVKKRGEEAQEFSGHETLYFVNGVPHKQGEYQAKVDGIVSERLFKLLTNPFYFNQMMNWNERREILFRITGNIDSKEIADAHPELMNLMEIPNGKTIDEYRKELAFRKSKLNNQLSEIAPRTDEVNKGIIPDPDYKQIEAEIQKSDTRLKEIDTLIASASKRAEKKNMEDLKKQARILELKQQISTLEYQASETTTKAINDARSRQNRLKADIGIIEREIQDLKYEESQIEKRKKEFLQDNDKLRNEWGLINEKQIFFKDDQFNCPACNRKLPEKDVEVQKAELTSLYNENKAQSLERISETGKQNKAEIQKIDDRLQKIKASSENKESEKEILTGQLSKVKIPEPTAIETDPSIPGLQAEMLELEKSLTPVKEKENSALQTEKAEISTRLDELKKILTIRENNEGLRERLRDLNLRQRDLAKQIAELEWSEFTCETFIRARAEMIEDKVNGLFNVVRFKLFRPLINGGMEETCEALISGVPFPDANHAAKINAGIDIIKTLSGHFDIQAPIFIDNAEAANEILETDSQMIKLFVTRDKELKVSIN